MELEVDSSKITGEEEAKLILTIEAKTTIKEEEWEEAKCKEISILTKIKIIWMIRSEIKIKTNW